MYEELSSLLDGFTVNGVAIPCALLYYDGDATTYITYSEVDKGNSLFADDKVRGYVSYFDFDIYTRGNYVDIREALIELLENNGWTYQPSRESPDLFETDTGYFHKTICLAKERMVNSNG